MKCTNCGAEMENNAKFCTNCGKNIESENQPNTEQPQTQPIQQQEPVTTYVNNGEPPKKKNNVVLIIVLVVLGTMLVLGIALAIGIKMFITNIGHKIEEIEHAPTISDTIDDFTNNSTDGEVVKTAKDPTGHEIKIVSDSVYIYKVDTSYLYDKADDMRKNEKKATEKEIEMSTATKEQKEAMKMIIEKLGGLLQPTEASIIEDLKNDNFDDATIKYALANCGVDWQEQANIHILTIAAAGGYSTTEIKDLMAYEGYEEDVINKALESAKIDYYEQATYNACFLRYTNPKYGMTYDRDGAKNMLDTSGFSKEEIEFALKIIYDEMK